MSAEVYRAYDAAGRLLYVGCSVNVESRLAHHEQHAHWWPFHVRIERTQFDTRDDALAAEAEAIATEHPRWNVQGRSAEHPDGFASTAIRATWLDYERDLANRFRQATAAEASAVRQARRARSRRMPASDMLEAAERVIGGAA